LNKPLRSIFIDFFQKLVLVGGHVRPENIFIHLKPYKNPMKKILVIHYSQTGQLTRIVQSILAPVRKESGVSIDFAEIRPKIPYPFPWTAYEFCDVFPESLAEIPCEIEPLAIDPQTPYDLVILAYQVWYLSPSIPFVSFLKSPNARRIINNRPVVTIIGCRNMWLLAQEKVKKHIHDLGGRLCANIVLGDKASNLLGVITICAWMFTGKKERFLKIFPKPGVADEDIRRADRFGPVLLDALKKDDIEIDQSVLNEMGAVSVQPAFIIFESRIHKIFNIWSRFIRQKGGQGAPERKRRVRFFLYYLLTAIFLIAPVATVASHIGLIFKRKKIKKAVGYFSQNSLNKEL
jgi:hypothetical protein